MAGRSLERSVENVFDGVFSKVFRSGLKPMQIGRRLIQQIDASRSVDARGRRVVPNTFVVELSPADREGLADLEPALIQELKEAARAYISREGYHSDGRVRIVLHTDPDLKRGRFEVSGRNDRREDEPARRSPDPGPAPLSGSFPPAQSPEPEGGSRGNAAFDGPPGVLTLPTGQRIEIYEGNYLVGRNLDCDIVISDTNVSRHHAELVCADGEVTIRDKGSTNGTKVNGVAVVSEQLLTDGDVISFGTAQVQFESS